MCRQKYKKIGRQEIQQKKNTFLLLAYQLTELHLIIAIKAFFVVAPPASEPLGVVTTGVRPKMETRRVPERVRVRIRRTKNEKKKTKKNPENNHTNSRISVST